MDHFSTATRLQEHSLSAWSPCGIIQKGSIALAILDLCPVYANLKRCAGLLSDWINENGLGRYIQLFTALVTACEV